jgi:CHAT domain-containing protein
MALNPQDQREIRLYLLGRLEPEHLAERVEERLMTEPDYYEELLVTEDELTDQYLSGELSAGERDAFERYFLRSPERVRRLRFAQAFDGYVSAAPPAAPPAASRGARGFLGVLWGSPARAAAFTLVVVACGALATWLVYFRPGSAFDEGLATLRSAYPERRPVEARMSGFGYAIWYVTRDGSEPPADKDALERAEFQLRQAEKKYQGPEADYALGSLYLARREYDRAIEKFESALKADGHNARLHNELGVALFEKGLGRRTGERDKIDLAVLSRAAEHFGEAVELDDSFLEARFNRALAYQNLLQRRQAVESWKDYLRRDSTSHWADEARSNLKLLEEGSTPTSRDTGQPAREFLDAWRAGDEAAAWRVVSQSYTSSGNDVVNGLLDSLLAPAGADAPATADEALPALSYLARLESDRSGDRFVSDLVSRYERTPPEQRPLLAEARGHMRAGQSHIDEMQFKEAVGEFTAARATYERAGDDAGKSLAEYRLAHCYVFVPDLEKARLGFERLHADCEAKQYRWVAARSLWGLAFVGITGGEYSKAADYSEQALAGSERADDLDGVLRCLKQLADVNQLLNRVGRSLNYLDRGLELAAQPSARPMERWGFLTLIAFNLDTLGLKRVALSYHQEALGLALEAGTPLYISRSYGYVGDAYAGLKKYPEALESARRAFEIGASISDKKSRQEIMANASLQLGNIHRQSGDCAKALEAYDRGIDLYARLNDVFYEYTAHKGKLLCLAAGADNRAVGDELSRVTVLLDRDRSKITAESQRLSYLDKEQDVYDLAIAYEAERVEDEVRAFEYSEESRARSLYDAIARGAEVLKKDYGPDVNLPLAASPLTYEEVRTEMPEGAQILQYAVLRDRLLIWVVTKSGPLRQEQVGIGEQALKEQVDTYLAAVRKPPAGDDDGSAARLGAELYRTLITPVEPYLDRSKYLCVAPSKVLHRVPFNALVSPSGRYLMEDYVVGSAPSSTIFVIMSATAAAKAHASKESLLSVGDPSFSPSAFPSLPGLASAAREAAKVADFYRPQDRLLLREDASEQQVRDGILKADVAHLALHYVVNSSSEMLSGFPLAAGAGGARGPDAEGADGDQHFHEQYGLKQPRTRLVVLSACQTGIEQEYAGEGAVGVTRPFLIAGVPVVVASLWPVDSDASAELMVAFHRHRTRDSLPAAQALARAQADLARGPDPRYRHPFHWAAFLAVGGQTTF